MSAIDYIDIFTAARQVKQTLREFSHVHLYVLGYGWVLDAVSTEGKCLEEIEALIHPSGLYSDDNIDFDRGARAAVIGLRAGGGILRA